MDDAAILSEFKQNFLLLEETENSINNLVSKLNSIIKSKNLNDDLIGLYKKINESIPKEYICLDNYSPLSRRKLIQSTSNFLNKVLCNIFQRTEDYHSLENLLKQFSCINYDGYYKNFSEDNHNKFIENVHEIIFLFLTVCFPATGLVSQFLHDWQELEKIIFEMEEEYREHFLHQFYVFLLGCILLEALMKRINFIWYFTEGPEKRPLEEMERRTFRSWLSASLFHDFGNFLTKINSINSIINKVYLNYSHFINITDYKVDIFEKNKRVKDYLNKMEAVAELGEFQYVEHFQKIGYKYFSDFPFIIAGFKKKDHGIISSLLFWNSIGIDIKLGIREISPIKNVNQEVTDETLTNYQQSLLQEELYKQIDQRIREENFGNVYIIRPSTDFLADSISKDSARNRGETRLLSVEDHLKSIVNYSNLMLEIREDMDIAAFAIAFHNLRPFKINFVKHPLTFILILCDELQQFGRYKVIKGRKKFIDIELDYITFFYPNDVEQLKQRIEYIEIFNFPYELVSNNNIKHGVFIYSLAGGDSLFWDKMKDKMENMFMSCLSNGFNIVLLKSFEGKREIVFSAWTKNDGNYITKKY